ncbi:hypothetical protein HYPSUDRAFT_48262 [Hypholoma sublateritium FD-334 SS-4]|uniref:Uncharacterized protein n=1 Tax=Hypholoma sublateritium (strain FD-334 SS-4) TaxID=945553 RepID=A0A0D2N8W4_HYPSF|nr:hypothetical protein HYPSUDRAFT_48262 [Hypholoma sublateritium FD-334 SS-4]
MDAWMCGVVSQWAVAFAAWPLAAYAGCYVTLSEARTRSGGCAQCASPCCRLRGDMHG